MLYIIISFIILGFSYVLVSNRRKNSLSKKPVQDSSTQEFDIDKYLLNKSTYKKAWDQFISKKYLDAIIELDKLIEIKNYRNKDTYDLRAMVAEQLGYFLDAIEDFDESIKLDSSDANVYFLRGLAKSRIGAYSEAMKDIVKASSMKPDMELYSQNISLMDTSAEIEEYAKAKAFESGKLRRREKFLKEFETLIPEGWEIREGIEMGLKNVRNRLKEDPNNKDLKNQIQVFEKYYKSTFEI